MVRSGSQARIQNRIDVDPQLRWVNPRKSTSPRDQIPRGNSAATEWSQFGNFCAITSDDDGFASSNASENIAAMVAQVAYCHSVHANSVSPVIHAGTGATQSGDNLPPTQGLQKFEGHLHRASELAGGDA